MNSSKNLVDIENHIFTIRGVQVMLDRDLAEMYQVETRVLNQAVKRNSERFPDDFCFQLTVKEFEYWKSQIVMSKSDRLGLRRPPFAFSEQGVAMLSSVLKSETAIKVNIKIIKTFVSLRKLMTSQSGLFQRLEQVERKQLETDNKFEQVFKALESKSKIPTQGVFFDGQVFDAYELASKIIRSAETSIILIDNYIDESTLTHLAKKSKVVSVILLTKKISSKLELDVKKVNEQYGGFSIKPFSSSHDRFLIIDDIEVYHLGASLKDLGKKWFAFSKMEAVSVESILSEISKLE